MDGKNDGARLLISVLGLPSCFGVVREANLGGVKDANHSLCLTEATSGLFYQNPDRSISFRCRGCCQVVTGMIVMGQQLIYTSMVSAPSLVKDDVHLWESHQPVFGSPTLNSPGTTTTLYL